MKPITLYTDTDPYFKLRARLHSTRHHQPWRELPARSPAPSWLAPLLFAIAFLILILVTTL